MLKKQSFSIKNSKSYLEKSPLAIAMGLFLVLVDSHAGIQKELDLKYTTNTKNKTVLMKQVRDLNNEEQDSFMLGKSFFTVPWVEAPSATTARDGLGPLFNSNTCINCHPRNGRGSLFTKKNTISRAYVTRLSIPSTDSKVHKKMLKYTGFVEEERYGAQISINGVPGVPYEAKPILRYKRLPLVYPDGSVVVLKQPLAGIKNKLRDLQYGSMNKDVSITNRLAPALIGLGLLEKITDKQILANEDIDDRDGDGISGKANIVYSTQDKDFRVGRFSYKASSASVLHQTAAAASNDMSLTNIYFPNENCTKSQTECLKAPKGDKVRGQTSFDIPLKRLKAISFYLKNLKIPKSTITQEKGEKLFASIGCVQCHTPSFTLENGYEVKPFSDILLHDMGENLSDARIEFKASPREWRTAPLWGIGKYILTAKTGIALLHDGRAKSVEEAILWHDGEAKRVKKNFMNLSAQDREKVIQYIKEL